MKKNKNVIIVITVVILLAIVTTVIVFAITGTKSRSKPEAVLEKYMSLLQEQKYEEMYELLTPASKEKVSKEDYLSRNKNIYRGIEATNIQTQINSVTQSEKDKNTVLVSYHQTMDTLCGNISFHHTVSVVKNEQKEYQLQWSSSVIYPELEDTDKVRVETQEAKRGSLLDRNGKALAQDGVVSSVGLVPGKMNKEQKQDITKIAELLSVSVDRIENDLNASYVKEDTFVPIKKVAKTDNELKEKLLEIPGIKIIDSQARVYSLGEEAAHLTGYIQNINAEELESLQQEGYDEHSVIGRTGLEKAYEKRLKGQDGARIYIIDANGKEKLTIAEKKVENGEDITLTIDSDLQKQVYDDLKKNKGLAVVMNPKTGEVLALVSTPSFDANDFILGMSNEKWNSLLEDEKNPLLNRYATTWTPGSTFKAITGAIGISTDKLDPEEDLGTSGLRWQKDKSWGDYTITTLTPYHSPANLRNAIIHSDNIYFAKAALKIGADTFVENLKKIGFGKKIPFEQTMDSSQFSNTETFESEIGLADSGYGQGQILVNPLHMASIYSAFVNSGNMVTPYLEYKENAIPTYWIEKAFTKQASDVIKEDLIQVIEDPEGTAKDAKIPGLTIAAKTGTAEIKSSKEDIGTELGWFNAFIADETSSKQLIAITMIQDAKQYGGSHYLFPMVTDILK